LELPGRRQANIERILQRQFRQGAKVNDMGCKTGQYRGAKLDIGEGAILVKGGCKTGHRNDLQALIFKNMIFKRFILKVRAGCAAQTRVCCCFAFFGRGRGIA
jgi:hypothetical protein